VSIALSIIYVIQKSIEEGIDCNDGDDLCESRKQQGINESINGLWFSLGLFLVSIIFAIFALKEYHSDLAKHQRNLKLRTSLSG